METAEVAEVAEVETVAVVAVVAVVADLPAISGRSTLTRMDYSLGSIRTHRVTQSRKGATLQAFNAILSRRIAGVLTFCAVMIFLAMGGGKRLFPTQAEYIPPVLLGFAAAAIVWGMGLIGSDRLKRRLWGNVGLHMLVLVPLIVAARFMISDGTAWLVAGGAMVLTLAINEVATRRSAR